MRTMEGRAWDWIVVGVLGVIVIAIFSGFVFSNRMFFGTDMIPMGYMMRKVVADYWRSHGSIPLWDGYILGGLPVVDAMHGDLFYPASILYVLMPLHRALGYKIIIHVWLAGLTMYFLLRTLGLRRRSSFLGGLSYMVAPYFLSLIYAGHDAKMFVTALFPLCVMLLEKLLRQPGILRAVLFGGSIGLLLLTSHPQMAYFASWGLGIYLILSLPRLAAQKRLAKGILLVVLAAVVGVGIGCVQILPTYYYTTNFSPRTGGVSLEFATSWSLHPEEIVSLLYPSFVGYLDSYWGRNPFKLNAESPGPLTLILALGAMVFFTRRRDLWPWLVLFVFCPLYALGAHTPVFKAVFYGLPGAKFLRAPSIIMFMFSCASSVLAAFLVDELLGRKLSLRHQKLLTGLMVLLLILIVAFTVGRMALLDLWRTLFAGIDGQELEMARRAGGAWMADALLVAVFGGAALGLLKLGPPRRWRGSVALAVLLAGILVTGLRHSVRFVKYINVGDFQRTDPMIEYVKQDHGRFRTLPVTGSSFYNRNYLPLFGLETANGFYDNRIRYYDYLVGEGFENLLHPSIMALTNVKYVLTSQPLSHPSLVLRRDLGRGFVYENQGFMRRAHILHRAVVAASDSSALRMLKSPDFDPLTTVVLHSGEPLEAGPPLPGEEASIESYQPDRVGIRARVLSPGYLFYSGNYLPYWKAYVDGEKTPLVRCDVAMRAIPLVPGDHTIEMRYESRWLKIGAYICLAACLLVGTTVAVSLVTMYKRTRNA